MVRFASGIFFSTDCYVASFVPRMWCRKPTIAWSVALPSVDGCRRCDTAVELLHSLLPCAQGYKEQLLQHHDAGCCGGGKRTEDLGVGLRRGKMLMAFLSFCSLWWKAVGGMEK